MTEQLSYKVVADFGGFELREYPRHIRVDVVASGSFMSAGSMAFQPLVGYISGRNRSQERIAMTAPVLQETLSDKDAARGLHRVSFVLPLATDPTKVPVPTDSQVTTRVMQPCTIAALKFGGAWSEARFSQKGADLKKAVLAAGLTALGEPYFARFDPPWKPGFMKHNEALIDISVNQTKGNK